MTDSDTMHRGTPVPRLTDGLDFMGEYLDSGLSESPYLLRRPDGQVVQLSQLLYLTARCVDGTRDTEGVAREVSLRFDRRVTQDNIEFILEEKLRPLGLLPVEDGEEPPPRLGAALLGLKYRVGVVPAGMVFGMTRPFLPLFRPLAVFFVLGLLAALDVWLLLFHGVLDGFREVIYQPSLILLFLGLELVAMAWHELGHAAACRYGGARPGVVGVGLYVIWLVFYSDVTDSYRLGRSGRLRVDLGGLYFDAIFTLGIAAVYLITGFEPLIVLILLNQIDALDEFSPFLRLDGYYVMSDLTGIPDPFRCVRPVISSLIPGRETDPVLKQMKPRVRVVMTVWVLAVVPVTLAGLAALILYGPWFVSTAWDSLLVQASTVSESLGNGDTPSLVLGIVNTSALLIPVVGGTLILAMLVKRISSWSWRRLRGGTA